MSLLLALAMLPTLGAPTFRPSPPRLSTEAREVLSYLGRISGKATIAGQHNYPLPGNRDEWMVKAMRLTGRYPGLWGSDFGWDKGCKDARPDLVEEAKRQWKAGSLVELTWHTVRPMDEDGTGDGDSWKGMVQGTVSDAQWKEIVTPGSPLNKRWVGQIDVIAGWLKKLRDARVPVLWRPYHEMNGGWFWWGGRKGPEGFQALYRQMHDRYTKLHRLDNLIWLWGPGAPDLKWAAAYKEFFPGQAYVDMLVVDIYNNDYRQSYYDDLVSLANGKPIGLGEVGQMPSADILRNQPRWTYFLVWAQHLVEANKAETIPTLYASPNVLTRDEVRSRKTAK